MNYKIWNGAAAIIIKDEKILMVRAKNTNSWSVPSGEIEDGETSKEACIREVWEETGYYIAILKELHKKKIIIEDYKVTTTYFLGKVIGGQMSYHDPDDNIEEISWKTRDEVLGLIHNYPEDKQMIEGLLLGQ
ncbi:NUDIX hydrolase [Bacillus ndiopicus]|uniref:NUDIX hydrolase n=1 Tax=Bacillus ndiopicus TaxID=1347368 RepID=UPI0005AAD8B8|nr:NUDIX hydrolase [Bacillus ndiopicus]